MDPAVSPTADVRSILPMSAYFNNCGVALLEKGSIAAAMRCFQQAIICAKQAAVLDSSSVCASPTRSSLVPTQSTYHEKSTTSLSDMPAKLRWAQQQLSHSSPSSKATSCISNSHVQAKVKNAFRIVSDCDVVQMHQDVLCEFQERKPHPEYDGCSLPIHSTSNKTILILLENSYWSFNHSHHGDKDDFTTKSAPSKLSLLSAVLLYNYGAAFYWLGICTETTTASLEHKTTLQSSCQAMFRLSQVSLSPLMTPAQHQYPQCSTTTASFEHLLSFLANLYLWTSSSVSSQEASWSIVRSQYEQLQQLQSLIPRGSAGAA